VDLKDTDSHFHVKGTGLKGGRGFETMKRSRKDLLAFVLHLDLRPVTARTPKKVAAVLKATKGAAVLKKRQKELQCYKSYKRRCSATKAAVKLQWSCSATSSFTGPQATLTFIHLSSNVCKSWLVPVAFVNLCTRYMLAT
jgi:hypothetical protein